MADCRSFAAEVCGELDLCYDKGASLALLSFGGEIAMSVKRRDNRNRILREGEYQRKDGRYRSRYLDEDSKEQNVYSWRLDKNDPMPKGKKREPSLREKEKQIEADLFDHIVTNGGKLTVLELVEKYVSLKTGVAIIRSQDTRR